MYADTAAQLKILVFATQNNPLAARISIALAYAGFHVAALTRSGHPVREVRKVSVSFCVPPPIPVEINSPRHRSMVSGSSCLHRRPRSSGVAKLHKRTASSGDKAGRRISDLIELSLGPPTSFSATSRQERLLGSRRSSKGYAARKPSLFRLLAHFESAPAELTYPIVVKADHSDGGRCVRIVNREANLRAVVWELQTPSTWRGRRFFGTHARIEALSRLMLPLRRTISLQEYIVGRPGNRAVICWKGKVLAGISVEAVEVTHEHGPASVIKLIDHSEMATACERMVKRLHLSGFVGFDFILDSRESSLAFGDKSAGHADLPF